MNGTFKDFKAIISRPRNAVIISSLFIISALMIDLIGYPNWRRFVMPAELLLTGFIASRIASQISQAAFFTQIIRTASNGIMMFAAVLFLAAITDAFVFGDIGYALFFGTVLLWLWIPLQLYRIYGRLRDLPEEKKLLVTESTDVILLQMDYRREEIQSVLDKVEPILEKHGIQFAQH